MAARSSSSFSWSSRLYQHISACAVARVLLRVLLDTIIAYVPPNASARVHVLRIQRCGAPLHWQLMTRDIIPAAAGAATGMTSSTNYTSWQIATIAAPSIIDRAMVHRKVNPRAPVRPLVVATVGHLHATTSHHICAVLVADHIISVHSTHTSGYICEHT